MFCEKVLSFYKTLTLAEKLPHGVDVLNPYQDKLSFSYTEKFYKQFYCDANHRSLILGINPGRLGGGLTGIPFTDPIKLEQQCGIKNDLQKKPELSADFIYRMIEIYGGAEKFYNNYFISAVCPLGFTKAGKNLNYYDDKNLQEAVTPFILETLKTQLNFGINKERCFCLGEGKNFEFLKKINQQHLFFKEIIPLPHPRFIMQYKRKKLTEFIDHYVNLLGS
jgi:hypothetical protein